MTDTPRLHTNSQTLSLSFESSLIQSCMRLDAPDALVLEYTRAMMGFLLFNSAPRSILMIGLGGGSLLKYCHKHLPDADLTVVEIEQAVIDLRHEFAIPPDDQRLRIVCDDGARFMSATARQAEPRFDAILVDGFTAEGQPLALCTPSFYRHCALAMAPQGMLVINMHSQQPALSLQLRRVSKMFAASALAIAVDDGDNQVVFAGPPELLSSCKADFQARWDALAPPHQATLGAASGRIERALRQGFVRPG